MHPARLLLPALLLACLFPRFAEAQVTAGRTYRLDRDLPYRQDPTLSPDARDRCSLDLYRPEGTNGFPTLVWFHGGGLTGGRRSVPRALERQGLAVVAAGYRLSPQAQAPTYLEDAAAAVAWTFRHIAEFGGATNRIFVGGHSAGGYLALMLGLDRRWLAAHGIDANALAGLVPASGQCITHFTIRKERGIPEGQPLVDAFAPQFHVRRDAPPVLLTTGDRELELLGRYEENAYLWRMLKIAGHPDVRLHELQGYDHGGMVEPAFPLVVRFILDPRRPAGR